MYIILEDRQDLQDQTIKHYPKTFPTRDAVLKYIRANNPGFSARLLNTKFSQIQNKVIRVNNGYFVVFNDKITFNIYEILQMFTAYHDGTFNSQIEARFSLLTKLFGHEVYFLNGDDITLSSPLKESSGEVRL